MNFFDLLKESKELSNMEEEHVVQILADNDINSIVDENVVLVDKSDVNEAKKILKKAGYGFLKVKAN